MTFKNELLLIVQAYLLPQVKADPRMCGRIPSNGDSVLHKLEASGLFQTRKRTQDLLNSDVYL